MIKRWSRWFVKSNERVERGAEGGERVIERESVIQRARGKQKKGERERNKKISGSNGYPST